MRLVVPHNVTDPLPAIGFSTKATTAQSKRHSEYKLFSLYRNLGQRYLPFHRSTLLRSRYIDFTVICTKIQIAMNINLHSRQQPSRPENVENYDTILQMRKNRDRRWYVVSQPRAIQYQNTKSSNNQRSALSIQRHRQQHCIQQKTSLKARTFAIMYQQKHDSIVTCYGKPSMLKFSKLPIPNQISSIPIKWSLLWH